VKLELLERTSAESPIAKSTSTSADSGLCITSRYAVPDIRYAAALKARGWRLIDE